MNKVKLQLDDLQVESFAVEPDRMDPGTVQGLQVDAESGLRSMCITWCTNCCSLMPTNCPLVDTCVPTCDTCDPAICPAAA